MAGRGTRLAPGKENCLVLDFAGNVARHGPIDAVKRSVEDRLRQAAPEASKPSKVCPDCGSIVAAAIRECPHCGHEFPPPAVNIAATASTLAILSTQAAQWMEVSEVSYRRHDKPGKPPSMRVDYGCGLVRHSEWICFEHVGYARQKAVAWWQRRSAAPAPATVTEALAEAASLATPVAVLVRPNGRFTEVIKYRFEPCSNPASAPSVAADPEASAGSMHATESATPGGTPAADSSAQGSAKTSAIGGPA